MSNPFRWHLVCMIGKRISIGIAIVAGILFVGESYGQSRETIDAVMSAGTRLSETNNSNLLGIITICSLILAGFFGWINEKSLQVIQQKITSIEVQLSEYGLIKKGKKGE